MKHLTLVILLALAPLSWGEDVYYCVEELSTEHVLTDSGDAYELKRFKPEKFTFKYEKSQGRLVFKGRTWAGDKPYYMDCDKCYPLAGGFNASNAYSRFMMKDGRYNYAAAYYDAAVLNSGTCTKF